MYQPLKIETMEVAGFMPSIRGMRKPKGTVVDSFVDYEDYTNPFILGDSDADLAGRLIRAGNDHAKAMRGIIVWVEMKFMVGWMIEFVTYRIGTEDLSTSSTMHNELKELSGYQLAEQKQKDLVNKVYERSEHFSYQALRGIYRARRRHRHPDWRIFCRWIEELPYFDKLIFPEFKPEEAVVLYER